MLLAVDEIFTWTSFGNGFGKWVSRCRIRVFHPHPEQIVVIASDLGEDSGTSITNCAESLATLVVRDFVLDPSLLLWIEHYPCNRQEDPQVEFSRVHFNWKGCEATKARWSPMSQQEAEALCGSKL